VFLLNCLTTALKTITFKHLKKLQTQQEIRIIILDNKTINKERRYLQIQFKKDINGVQI